MKLVLTSNGMSNDSLRKTLKDLVNGDIKIAFIPTAANVEAGDKDWLIDNLNDCRQMGSVEIVDISLLTKEEWLPKLEKANVIFVGGGSTLYLMDWIKKSGLKEELSKLLKERVYVGISAGSCVVSKKFSFEGEKFYEDEDGKEHLGLGYVNFNVFPHLDSPYFPNIKESLFEGLSQKLNTNIYALDNESAVVVSGEKTEVVSEGKWKYYPK